MLIKVFILVRRFCESYKDWFKYCTGVMKVVKYSSSRNIFKKCGRFCDRKWKNHRNQNPSRKHFLPVCDLGWGILESFNYGLSRHKASFSIISSSDAGYCCNWTSTRTFIAQTALENLSQLSKYPPNAGLAILEKMNKYLNSNNFWLTSNFISNVNSKHKC